MVVGGYCCLLHVAFGRPFLLFAVSCRLSVACCWGNCLALDMANCWRAMLVVCLLLRFVALSLVLLVIVACWLLVGCCFRCVLCVVCCCV